MPNDARATMLFALPDGSERGLRISRLDERQRRLRLKLPKAATCWDYAPLIDVVYRERGFADCRSRQTRPLVSEGRRESGVSADDFAGKFLDRARRVLIDRADALIVPAGTRRGKVAVTTCLDGDASMGAGAGLTAIASVLGDGWAIGRVEDDDGRH